MALYAFDGTWNDSTAPDDQRDQMKDTNVHRFRRLYQETVYYVDGVGSRGGLISKFIGGVTGAGAEERIEEQFKKLQTSFQNGDRTIDIVGYSRGAAIARMFVDRIGEAYENLLGENGTLTEPPPIRFLGLYDTVASFGIPWNSDEGDFQQEIPSFVANTFHAMALDETRETFGIERCMGDRSKITEVWFRGGHADIGGNATYTGRKEELQGNRSRSDIALDWMLAKARACKLRVYERDNSQEAPSHEAFVTAREARFKIGTVGTLSRRIHVGDLVHYSVDEKVPTKGIEGLLLRRIQVPTRIEDRELERQTHSSFNWISVGVRQNDNIQTAEGSPLLEHLSTKRNPFDVPPSRTWEAWFDLWGIKNPGIASTDEFWAPTDADRALAWDICVELMTRITTQTLDDDEGTDLAALDSVYSLFQLSRESMRSHGVHCANASLLLTSYLNKEVRGFLAKWHKKSVEEDWKNAPKKDPAFRRDLAEKIQPALRQLAGSLSSLAGVDFAKEAGVASTG